MLIREREPYRAAVAGLTPEQVAERDGYVIARKGQETGYTRHLYRSAAEYASWLKGWRCGREEWQAARRRRTLTEQIAAGAVPPKNPRRVRKSSYD